MISCRFQSAVFSLSGPSLAKRGLKHLEAAACFLRRRFARIRRQFKAARRKWVSVRPLILPQQNPDAASGDNECRKPLERQRAALSPGQPLRSRQTNCSVAAHRIASLINCGAVRRLSFALICAR